MRIGIVGDHNPSNKTHASFDLSISASGMEWEWVATKAVPSGDELVKRYSGLWIAPASPYKEHVMYCIMQMLKLRVVLRNLRQQQPVGASGRIVGPCGSVGSRCRGGDHSVFGVGCLLTSLVDRDADRGCRAASDSA